MISALAAALAAKAALAWAFALSVGWLLPAASAFAGGIVVTVFGGDWWLALIAAIALAGFVFIWTRWGLKPALAWLLAFAAFFIDQRAAERGAAHQAAKEKADADRRATARERTIKDVRSLPDAELRRRARRWVRDDR